MTKNCVSLSLVLIFTDQDKTMKDQSERSCIFFDHKKESFGLLIR